MAVINLDLQGAIPIIKENGVYKLVANQKNATASVVLRVDTSVIDSVQIILPSIAEYTDAISSTIYLVDIGGNGAKGQVRIIGYNKLGREILRKAELEGKKDLKVADEQMVEALAIKEKQLAMAKAKEEELLEDRVNGHYGFGLNTNYGVAEIFSITRGVWLANGTLKNLE